MCSKYVYGQDASDLSHHSRDDGFGRRWGPDPVWVFRSGAFNGEMGREAMECLEVALNHWEDYNQRNLKVSELS